MLEVCEHTDSEQKVYVAASDASNLLETHRPSIEAKSKCDKLRVRLPPIEHGPEYFVTRAAQRELCSRGLSSTLAHWLDFADVLEGAREIILPQQQLRKLILRQSSRKHRKGPSQQF